MNVINLNENVQQKLQKPPKSQLFNTQKVA